MTRRARGLASIDILSAMLLVAAIGLYFWPVRITVQPAVAAAVAIPKQIGQYTRASGDEAAEIVAANIMSASRRAPASRYVSPERGDVTDYTLPAAFQPAADTSSSKLSEDADAVPALYGIVNIDGTSRALLRLRESDVSPALMREGDARGSYRVVSIRTNAVIVAGPSGQRTLRMSKAARNDSTGKPQ